MRKPTHILYKTTDDDSPESICDRNGEVVLGLCRVCGAGEIELDERCDVRQRRLDLGIGWKWLNAKREG